MKHKPIKVIFILAAAAATCLSASVAPAKGTGDAVKYIKSRQVSNGGFAEPEAGPDGITTCWSMLAGTSAGERVSDWKNGGPGPVEYLSSQAGDLSKLDDIELYALAISEAGADPRKVGGKDLIALISAHIKSDGQIGDTAAQHCWGMMALTAAEVALPPKSTGWLVEHQRADGGWGESDNVVIQDTGLGVEALVAAGEESSQGIEPAMKYLRGKMGPEGGFAAPGGGPNTQLTSSVLRAIYASGADPSSDEWSWHGSNPVTFLDSLQAADGHYEYSKGKESQPLLTTSLAVPASEGKHFPLSTASGSPTSSNGIKDLGTTGAGMAAGIESSGTTPARPVDAEKLNASGAATSKGSFSGLWLFLMICGAYLVTMVAAGVIALRLYEPPPAPAVPPDTTSRTIT